MIPFYANDISVQGIGGTRPGNAVFVPPAPENVPTLLADMAGLEWIFCSLEGEDRVLILLTLLQRQQKVAVPLGAVAPG